MPGLIHTFVRDSFGIFAILLPSLSTVFLPFPQQVNLILILCESLDQIFPSGFSFSKNNWLDYCSGKVLLMSEVDLHVYRPSFVEQVSHAT